MSASKKRTLDAFFSPAPKRSKAGEEEATAASDDEGAAVVVSSHANYPFSIADLPSSLSVGMASVPARPSRSVNDQPDLDLVYFEPYIPTRVASGLFNFLRAELPFYRVEYDIKRKGVQTHVRTPRWTTVFGLDDTCYFGDDGCPLEKSTNLPVHDKRYLAVPPRPIPECLDRLRTSVESATGCCFNFCLVNYYASGSDSIAFHSDDERFLGKDPAIASISLGARRDFLLKYKPPQTSQSSLQPVAPQMRNLTELRFPLGSGDMMLMRGRTQSSWLHSIPKRTGKNQEDGGRINITFRRAMIKEGTVNYYRYNVGTGPVYRWDRDSRQMTPWES
ncbi:DNA repair family protein [Ophiocordyceps camponoti-floridani]|uniref:DNA repair family protein n=1 Tax=Ophiocordyceps camponoti-floridani TaxID=2030778 RepID=A0A8H4VCV7_9HYPO|nr:DNA repair family protein [Ophiocordyceps camponoti-floridani]